MGKIEQFEEKDLPFGDARKVVATQKGVTFDPLNPFDGIEILDLEEMFLTEPEPLDFVLPGLVKGTIGPIFSPGGVGKSLFVLQAGLHIACGRDSLGLGQLEEGRVVIFAGEDPKGALHLRLKAMYRQFQLTDKEIADAKRNLLIIPTLGRPIDIMNIHSLKAIYNYTDGARLAAFDTLTRYHSLDENKAEDAKRIMATLEELAYKNGPSVIFPHHVAKASISAGMQETQQAARGSSVFVDNARWASYIASMTEAEAKKLQIKEEDRLKFVKWNVCKQNYAAPISSLWMRRNKDGVLSQTNFLTEEQNAHLHQQATQSSVKTTLVRIPVTHDHPFQ